MYMLSRLPFEWLSFAVIVVAILSYFIALTIDGVFGKDGFGTIGNMVVLTIGFFTGMIIYELLGYQLLNFQHSCFVGVGGALLTFVTLATFKVIIDKIMH